MADIWTAVGIIVGMAIVGLFIVLNDPKMRAIVWFSSRRARKQRKEMKARKNPAAILSVATTLNEANTGDLSEDQVAAALEAEGFIATLGAGDAFEEIQTGLDELVGELTDLVRRGGSVLDVASYINTHFARVDCDE